MSHVVSPFSLVILAGGKSERMGTLKGLLPFENITWLESQLSKFKAAGGRKAVIGLGHRYEEYLARLPWLSDALIQTSLWHDLEIDVAVNSSPERGQFSTLQTALSKVDSHTKGVLVSPIDSPLPSQRDLETICSALSSDKVACIPQYMQSGTHPVLLSGKLIPQLMAAQDSCRLDHYLKSMPVEDIVRPSISTPSTNLNSIQDWQHYLEANHC